MSTYKIFTDINKIKEYKYIKLFNIDEKIIAVLDGNL